MYFLKLVKRFGIGHIFSEASKLILYPLVTKYVPISQYGLYEALANLKNLTFNVLYQTSFSSFARFYHRDHESKEFYGAIWKIFAWFFLPVFALAFVSKLVLFQDYSRSQTNILFILLTILSIFEFVFTVGKLKSIYARETKKFMHISIVQGIFPVAFAIVCMALFKTPIFGFVTGIVLGNLLLALFASRGVIRDFFVKVKSSRVKEYIIYGFPFALSTLAANLMRGGDRFVILLLLSVKDVGSYAFVYTFVSLISIAFLQPTVNILIPVIFKEEHNKKNVLSLLTSIGIPLLLMVALVCVVFAISLEHILPFIISNKEYGASLYLARILAIVPMMQAIDSFWTIGIKIAKKGTINSIVVVFAALLNIGIDVLFLKQFGLIVAAISTVISYMVMVLLKLHYARKYYPITYPWKDFLAIFGAYILAVGFNTYFLGELNAAVLALLSVLIFCIFIWITRVITRKRIRMFFRNINKFYQET